MAQLGHSRDVFASLRLLQVHHLRSSYFVALQAAYVALVAAMKQVRTAVW